MEVKVFKHQSKSIVKLIDWILNCGIEGLASANISGVVTESNAMIRRGVCVIRRWIIKDANTYTQISVDPRLFVGDLLTPKTKIVEIEIFKDRDFKPIFDARIISMD